MQPASVSLRNTPPVNIPFTAIPRKARIVMGFSWTGLDGTGRRVVLKNLPRWSCFTRCLASTLRYLLWFRRPVRVQEYLCTATPLADWFQAIVVVLVLLREVECRSLSVGYPNTSLPLLSKPCETSAEPKADTMMRNAPRRLMRWIP